MDVVGKISRVIELNIDFEKLLDEFGNFGSHQDLSKGWSQDLIELLYEQAEAINQPPSTYITHLLVKRMKDKTIEVNCVISLTVDLKGMMYLDVRYLMDSILQDIRLFPFDCIVKLHQNDIVNIRDLLLRAHSRPIIKDYFISNLIQMSYVCQANTFQCFVKMLSEGLTSPDSSIYKEILLAVIKNSFTMDKCSSESFYSVIDAIADTNSLSSDDICGHILAPLLCTPHPSIDKKEVLSIQSQLVYTSLPLHVSLLYSKICKILGSSYCSKSIINFSCNHKINWRELLSFCSCYFSCYSNQMQNFKDILYDQVVRSIYNSDSSLLITCVILARQAALTGAHLFPSYSEWFKVTFSSSVISSKKDLIFLIQFLTSIVPYEILPDFLKVHIHWFPRKFTNDCQNLIDDYKILAKTRLFELNELLVETTETVNELSVAEGDVKDCLKAFEASKCQTIPSKILEISIFNRPYFIGRFLRVLLAPRHIPEPPDVRELLITALKGKGKIPNAMYLKYKDESKGLKMQEKMSTGDLSNIILYEPLISELEKLHMNSDSSRDENNYLHRKQLICTLSDNLDFLLMNISTSLYNVISQFKSTSSLHHKLSPSLIHVKDLQCPGLTDWEIKVVDILLEHITKYIIKVKDSTDGNNTKISLVVRMFVKMLSSHESIHWPFFVRLWELLHCQSVQLDDCHLYSLSVICAEMFIHQISYAHITTMDVCSLNCDGQNVHLSLQTSTEYSLFLLNSLRMCTKVDMMICSKVYCYFFNHFLATSEEGTLPHLMSLDKYDLVKHLILKVSYLFKRSNFACEDQMDIIQLNDSETFELIVTVISPIGAGFNEINNLLSRVHTSPEYVKVLKLIPMSDSISYHVLLDININPYNDYLLAFMRQQFKRTLLVSLTSQEQADIVFQNLLCVSVTSSMRSTCLLHSDTPLYNNISDTLQLLMELINMCKEDEVSVLLHSVEKSIKAKHHYTVQVVRICTNVIILSLPPYLLFTNSLSSSSLVKVSIAKTAEFIQHYLIPYLLQSFILPIDFCFHMIQGLFSAMHQSLSFSFASFIKSCPIFMSSVIHFWDKFKLRFSHTLAADHEFQSQHIHLIDSFNAWLQTPDKALMSHQLSVWFGSYVDSCTVNLFMKLITMHKSLTEIAINRTVSSLPHRCVETFVFYLFQCCVFELLNNVNCMTGNAMIDIKEVNISLFLAQQCLGRDQDLWKICKQMSEGVSVQILKNSVLTRVVDHLPIMVPCVYLKLLSTINDSRLLHKLVNDQDFISYTFQSYSRLFCHDNASNDDDQLVSFHPSFMNQCTKLMKTLVNITPTSLKNLSPQYHEILKSNILI